MEQYDNIGQNRKVNLLKNEENVIKKQSEQASVRLV